MAVTPPLPVPDDVRDALAAVFGVTRDQVDKAVRELNDELDDAYADMTPGPSGVGPLDGEC